jgi:DNA-binding NtrC family response regulator
LFRKFAADFSDRYKGAPIQLNEEAKNLLMQYPWPGNVRELKNIAEQISVLSKEKNVTATELAQFLPQQQFNRLPVLANGKGSVSQQEFANEREILYKLFFDMKKDVNELKKMFYDMLQNPGMVQHVNLYNDSNETLLPEMKSGNNQHNFQNTTQPMFINHHGEDIQQLDAVEESLSIVDKEKELIIKALKKHKSKRKDAAADLGISERTLYRKLKEYDIED